LSDQEREVFVNIIATNAPSHFRPSDLPLLSRFCEACVMAEQAAREIRQSGLVVAGRLSPYAAAHEKATKTMSMLALRLRLSPQARAPHTKTQRGEAVPNVYERMRLEHEGD
jgi:phage terminase small subunit